VCGRLVALRNSLVGERNRSVGVRNRPEVARKASVGARSRPVMARNPQVGARNRPVDQCNEREFNDLRQIALLLTPESLTGCQIGPQEGIPMILMARTSWRATHEPGSQSKAQEA